MGAARPGRAYPVSLRRMTRTWWSTLVVAAVVAAGPLLATLVVLTVRASDDTIAGRRATPGALVLLLAIGGVVWLVAVAAIIQAQVRREAPTQRWPMAPAIVQRWADHHVELSVLGAGPLDTWTATNPEARLDQLIAASDDAPELPLHAAFPTKSDDEGPAADFGAPRPADPVPVPVTTPVVDHEVSRGDTLWGLAERHLGAGTRWTEIEAVNRGRLQTDGTTIDADHALRRGTTIVIPRVHRTESSP